MVLSVVRASGSACLGGSFIRLVSQSCVSFTQHAPILARNVPSRRGWRPPTPRVVASLENLERAVASRVLEETCRTGF